MFLLQIYKLNVLLAKNIISKGRGFLEQNVNLTETPAVSKPQKFKICGTADFAKKKKKKKIKIYQFSNKVKLK